MVLQQRQVGDLERREEHSQLQPTLEELHAQLRQQLQVWTVDDDERVATCAKVQRPRDDVVEALRLPDLGDLGA